MQVSSASIKDDGLAIERLNIWKNTISELLSVKLSVGALLNTEWKQLGTDQYGVLLRMCLKVLLPIFWLKPASERDSVGLYPCIQRYSITLILGEPLFYTIFAGATFLCHVNLAT